MKILHLICAVRPNFMKIAPLYHALKDQHGYQTDIVHAGQHHDHQMSQSFFDDFHLPKPHHQLGIFSKTHAQQTAETMMAYEELCLNVSKPDLVIVVGDVNATMACAITAKKLHITVAYLEAGLRRFDPSMPTEINRVVTDAIVDYHWTSSQDANDNLIKEGIEPFKISLVGHMMIDTYCMMKDRIHQRCFSQNMALRPHCYGVLTLHRSSNLNCERTLAQIIDVMGRIDQPIVFPVHPRMQKTLEKLTPLPNNIRLTGPLSYIDFMSLLHTSSFVVSDSGGVQEEATYLGIPCFTLRATTECLVTVTMGSNQLVSIESLLDRIHHPKTGRVPPLWDGKTAGRIVSLLQKILS